MGYNSDKGYTSCDGYKLYKGYKGSEAGLHHTRAFALPLRSMRVRGEGEGKGEASMR